MTIADMPFHIPAPLASVNAITVPISLLALLVLYKLKAPRRPLPYPPGPRALPFLGNILDMPQSKSAMMFAKFRDQYGPMTWLTTPGQNILVVNSFKAATELLAKQPSRCPDRPRFIMANELVGLNNLVGLNPYNDMCKQRRSHMKRALSAAVVKKDYAALFEMNAQQYVERCVDCPENVLYETKRILGETIIKLTYGKLQDNKGTDYIRLSNRIMDLVSISIQGYLVDLLPVLRYLPKWLPGMQFKRDAAGWKKEIRELENTVFEVVRENALSDDPEVTSSFTFKRGKELHDKYEGGRDTQQHREDEAALAYSALELFAAGLDTTEATMQSFIQAMILFPSVQKKVQAEIDGVVGSGRFPTFQDQPKLPFLHATILEILRWNPAASLTLPHVSKEDIVYEDTPSGTYPRRYFIPKGTSIITNAWALGRDSTEYPNPSEFDPERYLKQDPDLDPREFVFGYGLRICPGKDLAFQNIWILVASVLWAFEVVGVEDSLATLADVDRFTFGLIK